MKIITAFLTCANDQEANKITDALLDKHLVVCVKKTNVSSQFLWKGNKEKAEEVLLIMDTVKDKFEDIEKEVKKIHSYETFVLTAVDVCQSSSGVEEWISNGLKENDPDIG